MKAKKFIPLLFVAAALSSCDFTEDCDYFGWLRVENNWQGYNDIPSSPDRNYALMYSDDKGYQGEYSIVPYSRHRNHPYADGRCPCNHFHKTQ